MNGKNIPAKYGVLIIIIAALIYLGIDIARGRNGSQIIQDMVNVLWLIPLFIVISLIYYFINKRKA